jgi:hypothetical protein
MASILLLSAVPLAFAASSDGTCLLSTRARFQRTSAQQEDMPAVAWRAFEDIAADKRKLLEAGSQPGAKPQGSVFESVEVSLPLEPPILKHDRASGAGQGDKNIVGLTSLTRGGRKCVVYGMGIATDSSFEQDMQQLGCETHAFDCTIDPNSKAVAGKQFKFHHWCIGSKEQVDTPKSNYVKTDKANLVFKSLAQTMQELGHNNIDLLKFDIEGFEWQLFQNDIIPGKLLPEQMSFELHTQKANPAYVPHDNVADKDFVKVNQLFKSLHDRGYRVTSKEVNSGDSACAEFVVVNVEKHFL